MPTNKDHDPRIAAHITLPLTSLVYVQREYTLFGLKYSNTDHLRQLGPGLNRTRI